MKKHIAETPTFKDNTVKNTQLLNLFERKTIVFIGLCFGLYFLLSFCKIHTSSVAIWDQFFGIQKPKSLIMGSPRGIRQDEWMLVTPLILGQNNLDKPISNIGLGDGNIPVMLGQPIHDFTMLLRPNLWSYFIFDIERAFAFGWNYTIFGFLISTFLLFLLLTKNQFWVSAFGTILLFLASGMQWWSYWIGGNMININLIAISFVCLLFANNAKTIIISSIVLLLGCYNFCVGLYPPWQIPLVYLYLAIIIGLVVSNWNNKLILDKLYIKIGAVSVIFVIFIISILHYYDLVKDTYEVLLNTAYPGKRTTNGGDLVQGKLFSEFFGIFMTDIKLPAKWLNICEASSFIMFFPIIFYSMIYNYFKTKTFDWSEVLISIYLLIMLVWMLIGFPEFLSKASLMSMSPTYRTLPIFGVANIILLVIYLSKKKETVKLNYVELGAISIATFIFLKFISANINKATSNFFTSGQVMFVCVFFTIIYLIIRYKDYKYSLIFLTLLLFAINFNNLKIHPITIGLSALTENPIVKSTANISKTEPNARWVVFGNQMLTNLLKVNGIKVFNGVKHVPILADMKVLDPTGKDNFIYNRYAHINVNPFIDMKDSIVFKLNENEVVNDNYSIFMDPCSPRFKQLGVKYIAFTYQPQPSEVRSLTLVSSNGIFIFKNDL